MILHKHVSRYTGLPMSIRYSILLVVALLVARPSQAQVDPLLPEYPDFKPGASMMADGRLYSLALLNLFEVAPATQDVPARFEGFYHIGDDYTRLWLKGEGAGVIANRQGEAEAQALYSRLISPYVEAQAGIRLDLAFGGGALRARPQLVVGLEGLVPYWFEVEPAVFLSAGGDLSARLEGSYDLLLTQRLILQPEAEVDLAIQEVKEWDVGRGLNSTTAGLRLRYEIRREVAPYVGLAWTRRFGRAADFAREAGGTSATDVFFVIGARLWR